MGKLRYPVMIWGFWLFAAAILGTAAMWAQSIHSVESWPTERARVLRSEVVSTRVGEYRGKVEVELASGHREDFDLGFSSSSRSSVEKALGRTPADTDIMVHVSPETDEIRLPLALHSYLGPGILVLLALSLGLAPVLVVHKTQRGQTPKVVSWALYGTACLFLIAATGSGWQRAQILEWPSTQATVLKREALSQPARAGGSRIWMPVLTVRYQAVGETIESKLRGVRSFGSEASAQEYLEQTFPVDEEITVQYHPKWPKAATFEARVSLRFFGVSILLAFFSGLLFMLGRAVGKLGEVR